MAGPLLAPTWGVGQWHHLGSKPSEIYFSYTHRSLYALACSPPHISNRTVSLPAPSSYPASVMLGKYLFTVAPLENVTEVTPCLGVGRVDPLIVGLLFRYSDGRRACVGEFRLDRCGTTMEVGTSGGLFLGLTQTMLNRSCVTRVEIFRPKDRAPLTWLDLPWKGNLEWWFSHTECQVSYDG